MTTYKILVADDDPALLASIRIRLASEGYEVVCAGNGIEAIEMAMEQQPDLLILDIHLPAGDGFSVKDCIQRQPHLSSIPIIYVTGDRSEGLREKIHTIGVRWLLRKPFDTIGLLTAVRESLEPRGPRGESRQLISV